MLVDVMVAEPGSAQIVVAAQGNVIPKTQTTIVSEVSGLIVEVSSAFVAGGFFQKGDVLVRIDNRNYRAEVKRAEASVAAAETKVTQELGLADYAEQDWERAKSSLNSSKAASDLALRKPQVAEAIANLEFAKADLEKRRGDLDRTVIRAPYDGLVREKIADLGQFVNASSSLARLFSTDVAEIRLPLPDKDLPFIQLNDAELQKGNGPNITLSASLGGQTHSWRGQVVRTEGVFDERSRVLYLVAEVSDPYNQQSSNWQEPLRVGTFVDARIEGETLLNVVRLPRSVLQKDNTVWTVDSERTLHPVKVEIVQSDETSVLVSADVIAGQLICKTLLDNPLPGTPVQFSTPVPMNAGIDYVSD
jgi:RND family efflux transporter MFP subunit